MTHTPIIRWRWLQVDGLVFHAVEARHAPGSVAYETACGLSGKETVLAPDGKTETCTACHRRIIGQWIDR